MDDQPLVGKIERDNLQLDPTIVKPDPHEPSIGSLRRRYRDWIDGVDDVHRVRLPDPVPTSRSSEPDPHRSDCVRHNYQAQAMRRVQRLPRTLDGTAASGDVVEVLFAAADVPRIDGRAKRLKI